MNRNDYGRKAITGILSGGFLTGGGFILKVIGSVLINFYENSFGNNPLFTFLGGHIAVGGGIILQGIGFALSLFGFICGIIWLYRLITQNNKSVQ